MTLTFLARSSFAVHIPAALRKTVQHTSVRYESSPASSYLIFLDGTTSMMYYIKLASQSIWSCLKQRMDKEVMNDLAKANKLLENYVNALLNLL